MNQEEAERALEAWASFERDEVVRAALAAGVSKNRIHAITGLSRTTIDKIMESSMTRIQKTKLVNFLTQFTGDWPRPGYPSFRFSQRTATAAYTAEHLAETLFADVEFKALKLGTFLNTPDGQLLAEAVEALAPPLYQPDIKLLVEALQLAADKQHQEAQDAVLKTVTLVLGAGVVAAVLAAGNS